MKGSLLWVVAAAVVALGACAGDTETEEVPEVEEPAPVIEPMPAPAMPMDTMPMDTTMADTAHQM